MCPIPIYYHLEPQIRPILSVSKIACIEKRVIVKFNLLDYCLFTYFIFVQNHQVTCGSFPMSCPNGCGTINPRDVVKPCLKLVIASVLLLRGN